MSQLFHDQTPSHNTTKPIRSYSRAKMESRERLHEIM